MGYPFRALISDESIRIPLARSPVPILRTLISIIGTLIPFYFRSRRLVDYAIASFGITVCPESDLIRSYPILSDLIRSYPIFSDPSTLRVACGTQTNKQATTDRTAPHRKGHRRRRCSRSPTQRARAGSSRTSSSARSARTSRGVAEPPAAAALARAHTKPYEGTDSHAQTRSRHHPLARTNKPTRTHACRHKLSRGCMKDVAAFPRLRRDRGSPPVRP